MWIETNGEQRRLVNIQYAVSVFIAKPSKNDESKSCIVRAIFENGAEIKLFIGNLKECEEFFEEIKRTLRAVLGDSSD